MAMKEIQERLEQVVDCKKTIEKLFEPVGEGHLDLQGVTTVLTVQMIQINLLTEIVEQLISTD
jgi:hypothetical protein